MRARVIKNIKIDGKGCPIKYPILNCNQQIETTLVLTLANICSCTYLFSVLTMGREDVFSQEGMNAKQIVNFFHAWSTGTS